MLTAFQSVDRSDAKAGVTKVTGGWKVGVTMVEVCLRYVLFWFVLVWNVFGVEHFGVILFDLVYSL